MKIKQLELEIQNELLSYGNIHLKLYVCQYIVVLGVIKKLQIMSIYMHF